MANVIANDGTLTIEDGGIYTYSGPSYGSAVPVTLLVKRLSRSLDGQTVSARGWGDFVERLRPTFVKAEVSVDVMIEDVGELDLEVGNFARFTHFTGGSATPKVYEGIVTKNSGEFQLDEMSMQTLVLSCNAA